MDTQQEQAEALARQFYAKTVLEELAGKRVRIKTDVDRGIFTIEAGALGVVQPPFLHEGKLVAAVKLDDPPEEAEPFDGEVHWMEDVNLFDFEDEVELE